MDTRKHIHPRLLVLMLSSVCLFVPGTDSRADDPSPPPLSKLGKKLQQRAESIKEPEPTAILESWWPGHPEWLATFAEIMAGNTLTPVRGWYKKSVGQSRFDWKATRSLFDTNGDRRISREEIALSDEDFARLDLNRDGLLSSIDMTVISERALLSRMASQFSSDMFWYLDKNRDGYADSFELGKMFYQQENDLAFDQIFASVREDLIFRSNDAQQPLTLNDFQITFELAARRGTLPLRPLRNSRDAKRQSSASKSMISFLKQDLGAWGPGPSLNDQAPDFRLPASDGTADINLSNFLGDKPLILIFGNVTCGPFRSQAASLDELKKRYKDRANFLVVYTRESHPVNDTQAQGNRPESINLARTVNLDILNVAQPLTQEARVEVAQTCQRRMNLGLPMVVDTMDDRVSKLYSGTPSRMYLIDKAGKIAYKGGRGPYGFKPFELEQALVLLLRSEASPDVKSAQTTNQR